MRQWAAIGTKAQTCVTSPPYFGLRDYGHPGQLGLEKTPEEFIANMVEVFRCVRDVLADDGTLWLNIGDSYANDGKWGGKHAKALHGNTSIGRTKVQTGLKRKDLIGIPWMLAFALRADGWYLRQDIIWHKPNLMPESVTDRCTKAHEYIFLLSKSERYYFDSEAIKEPAVWAPWMLAFALRADGWYLRQDIIWHKPNLMPESVTDRCTKAHEYIFLLSKSERYYFDSEAIKEPAVWAPSKQSKEVERAPGYYGGKGTDSSRNDKNFKAIREMRNRRSVWTVATRPYKGAHFATFPPALIEPCILAGSRPGDIVLDPFMGSGTTAQVAKQHGRHWLGCELNESYGPLQQQRIAE